MTDERDPDHGPPDPTGPPDGYHAVPEGYGNVEFLDEDGKPMTPDEFDAYVERKRRRLAGGRREGGAEEAAR